MNRRNTSPAPGRYDAVIADLTDAACLRMLLQQKGYPAGATGTARARGRLPGHLPRPDRRRPRRTAAAGRPPALRLRAELIDVHRDRPAARPLHRRRRRFCAAPRRRRSGVQPGGGGRRRRQGVDQVVRGDDLLPSSPRQAYLGALLGYPTPVYAHVPLVLNTDGQAAGQTRRRGDAGRDRGAARAAQIADVAGVHGVHARRDARRVRPGRLPRPPWIYRPSGGP